VGGQLIDADPIAVSLDNPKREKNIRRKFGMNLPDRANTPDPCPDYRSNLLKSITFRPFTRPEGDQAVSAPNCRRSRFLTIRRLPIPGDVGRLVSTVDECADRSAHTARILNPPDAMATQTADQLRQGSCKPCEGGVDKMSPDEARSQLEHLDGWELSDDATMISKKWNKGDFVSSIAFFQKVADIAEAEQHHPDLHLTGYRNVRIDLSTHAIGGLSENDFIVAAKIDAV